MEASPAVTSASVGRLAGYLRPHWRAQSAAVVASLVAAGADLPIPLLIKVLVDEVATEGQLDLLAPVLAALGGLAVLTVGASALASYLFTSAGEQAINVLRADLMQHVFRLPLEYFRRTRTGETVAHFTSDAGIIANAYERAYGQGVAAVVQVLGIVVVVAVVDWRFGLAAAGLVPVYMVVPRLLRGHQLRAGGRVQDAVGRLGGLGTEVIAAARDIRAFGGESWAIRRLRGVLYELRHARTYQGLVGSWSLVTASIFWLTYAVIFAVLAEPILQGAVTIGFALAMARYFTRLDNAARPLVSAYTELQQAAGAAARVFQLLDRPHEQAAEGPIDSAIVTKGEIEFQGVSAAYETGGQVLRDVSFKAHAGHLTALVGPSGAGKSTIVNLALGLLQPNAGLITIDGHDITKVDLADVRRRIGVVLQDAVLFDGSIAENIRFGRDELGDVELRAAAVVARADDYIRSSRDGYATRIGERGLRLSGGQAQRLLIARAVAAQPSILVLDEATAALDADSERLVLDALTRSARGRTTLVIAHRLATVRMADHIVVLDEGVVLDRGRHDELYERCAPYRDLCDLQMAQPVETVS